MTLKYATPLNPVLWFCSRFWRRSTYSWKFFNASYRRLSSGKRVSQWLLMSSQYIGHLERPNMFFFSSKKIRSSCTTVDWCLFVWRFLFTEFDYFFLLRFLRWDKTEGCRSCFSCVILSSRFPFWVLRTEDIRCFVVLTAIKKIFFTDFTSNVFKVKWYPRILKYAWKN